MIGSKEQHLDDFRVLSLAITDRRAVRSTCSSIESLVFVRVSCWTLFLCYVSAYFVWMQQFIHRFEWLHMMIVCWDDFVTRNLYIENKNHGGIPCCLSRNLFSLNLVLPDLFGFSYSGVYLFASFSHSLRISVCRQTSIKLSVPPLRRSTCTIFSTDPHLINWLHSFVFIVRLITLLEFGFSGCGLSGI